MVQVEFEAVREVKVGCCSGFGHEKGKVACDSSCHGTKLCARRMRLRSMLVKRSDEESQAEQPMSKRIS